MKYDIKKEISLKETNSHLQELEAEIEAKNRRIALEQQEIREKQKIAKNLRKKKKKMESPKELQCSEHSLIRYAERVLKIDFEAIKKEILSPEIIEMLKTLPNSGTFPNKAGYSVVIKNGMVTTIIV